MRTTAWLALVAAVSMAVVAAVGSVSPAVEAQPAQDRLVVFETFGRLNCSICKAAGPTVNKLGHGADYAGKALFLEHDVDDRADARRGRWWVRKQADDPNAESATTPLILVDSGRTYGDGRTQPFESKYRGLVDEAATEPALVAIDAEFLRDRRGNRLLVGGTITNTSETTLGYDNVATLWLMAFEETHVIHVDWFVRAAAQFPLEEDLAPGATLAFDEAIDLPSSADINLAQVVVLLEFRSPDVAGAFRSANAALAIGPDVPIQPTATPVPESRLPAFLPALARRAGW